VVPQGAPLTTQTVGEIAAEAKILGYTQEQAQSLINARATAMTTKSQQYLADLTAHPTLGGAKLDATIEAARRGRDWAFPPGTPEAKVWTDFFLETGAGNHPAVVAFFARLGSLRAEDRPGPVGTPPPPGDDVPLEDKMFPSSAKKRT